jgi:2,3-bisphosphoglycerate-independent phosphoglycerate mutase
MLIQEMYIDYTDDDKIYSEGVTISTSTSKGKTMKNINSRALKLAHEIKPAYSSFRLALIAAYKAIKSTADNFRISYAMIEAATALYALNLKDKAKQLMDAWEVLYDLEYLD